MASNDQWPPVSLAAAGKGSSKINGAKKFIKESQQETLRKLNEMFDSTLEPAVILSVVQNCNWELQPSIEGLITLSETVDNTPSRNKTVPETRNPVSKVSRNRGEQHKTESTKIVEDHRISKPPENLSKAEIANDSTTLVKSARPKRSGTKNRMGSFCGNIAKLKSSVDNNSQNREIDTKIKDSISPQFDPFFKDSCLFGATGPAYVPPTVSKPISYGDFPDVSLSSDVPATKVSTSEKKNANCWKNRGKDAEKKNNDKPDQPINPEETNDWLNKNRMIASFDSKTSIRKNESESLCGLKVQYRLSGMESSSDDDADVVIEDESSDYKINLSSVMATNVSQFLSPSTQTPPLRTKPDISMISTPSPPRTPQRSIYDSTLARIKATIIRGDKILIILRGLPGSGKSTLAKNIVSMTIGGDSSLHVYSTDDFFVTLGRGIYKFDPTKLSDAHNANQTRVSKAMKEGRNPIIVDNTNVEAWEMRPYAAMAVKNGYIVEIIEPNTPWARNPKELAEKNTHNLPKAKIIERALKFESITSGKKLLEIYGLKYSAWNKPQQYTQRSSSLNGEKKKNHVNPCIEDIQSNWENDEKNNYVLSSHDIESMQNIDETHNAQSINDKSQNFHDNPGESNVENAPRELITYADKVFSDYLQDSDDESFEMIDDPSSDDFSDKKKIVDIDVTSGSQDNIEIMRNIITDNKEDCESKDTSSNSSQQTLGAIGSERKFNNSSSASNYEFEKEDNDNKGNGLSQCWDFTLILEGYKLHSRHGHYVSPFAIQRDESVVSDNIIVNKNISEENQEKNTVLQAEIIQIEKPSIGDDQVENSASKEENLASLVDVLKNNEHTTKMINFVNADTKFEVLNNPSELYSHFDNNDKDFTDNSVKELSDIEILKDNKNNESEGTSGADTSSSLLNSTKTSLLTEFDESFTTNYENVDNPEDLDECISLLDDNEEHFTNLLPVENLINRKEMNFNDRDNDKLINRREGNFPNENQDDLINFNIVDSPKIENLAETIAESVTSAGIIESQDKIFENDDDTSGVLSRNSYNDEIMRSKKDEKNIETSSLLTDNINSISWKESPFPVDDTKIPILPILDDKKIVPKKDAQTMTTFYDFNVAYVGGTSEPEYRELWGVSRSINEGTTNVEKIDNEASKIIMFDKSSMTGETDILAKETNENMEKVKDSINRLDDLIEMFPHYPREYLKTLYEQQCNCNFDWVVDVLLLADVPNLTIENYEKKHTNSTINNDDNIIDTVKLWKKDNEKLLQRSHSSSPRNRRNKSKDFRSFSLDSASDRNCTNCEISFSSDNSNKNTDEEEDKILQLFYANAVIQSNSPVGQNDLAEASSSSTPSASINDTVDDDNEEIMELNFGRDFINRLENTCGNADFVLPDEFKPVIKIKKSMVHELYGLWIKSMDDQMKVLHAQLDERMAKDEAMARAVDREQSAKCTEPVVPNLEEIMNMEMALARYQNESREKIARETPNDMASRLTRQMLYELLPDIDQQILSDLLKAHNGNFKETCEIIEANIGRKISKTDTLKKQQSLLERVNEERINQDVQQNSEIKKIPVIVVNPDIYTSDKSETSRYDEAIKRGRRARMDAQKQFSLRIENYNKAAEAYRKGQPEVAAYYSQMVKLHTENANAAHSEAADEFLSAQMFAKYGEDTLDLHNLFVREALEALDVFLDYQSKKLNKSNKRSSILFIITGYGARSNNGLGKIKPAVSKKLTSRNIRFTEANPGCLRVTLSRRNATSD